MSQVKCQLSITCPVIYGKRVKGKSCARTCSTLTINCNVGELSERLQRIPMDMRSTQLLLLRRGRSGRRPRTTTTTVAGSRGCGLQGADCDDGGCMPTTQARRWDWRNAIVCAVRGCPLGLLGRSHCLQRQTCLKTVRLAFADVRPRT